ncbi:probable cytochrome P450 313a4 isoform X2 [Drosophila novamexicana]|uniref:probable cytochrome P450 313a4 isoform X2 n=1 Tax=Drosophila novamexicana TaxID=47314 RepID=UPI0011E5C4BE|nr:probable cytochrome P450 313a4 isoform X2 [Drosophila novamexicana]
MGALTTIGCSRIINDMCFSPWLSSKTVRQLFGKEERYSSAKSEIRGFIRKLIERKLARDAEIAENGNPSPLEKNIFLNLATDLLKRGIFSWKNVEDESNVIVFGAFETTANTVAYTLILLSMFPKYQEKAFEEILALFPDPGDFEVTYADTQEMVYLDLILNESMRVIPPVPVVSRQTSQDVLLSSGVVVPKGVQIAIDIFHLHRSKKIWGEDAETFDPEHFLPHHYQNKHPYAFIPFTKGIRNCIGWRYALISAKITLAKLLRNYKFSTSFKFEDLYFVEDITIKLKTVPLLKLQRRT